MMWIEVYAGVGYGARQGFKAASGALQGQQVRPILGVICRAQRRPVALVLDRKDDTSSLIEEITITCNENCDSEHSDFDCGALEISMRSCILIVGDDAMTGWVVKFTTSDGTTKWLSKTAEGKFDYTTDPAKAHVFPTADTARATAYSEGRYYRTPPELVNVSEGQ